MYLNTILSIIQSVQHEYVVFTPFTQQTRLPLETERWISNVIFLIIHSLFSSLKISINNSNKLSTKYNILTKNMNGPK